MSFSLGITTIMYSTRDSSDTYTPKLLINAIEEKATWTPNDTFMRYPETNWETEGYNTISYIKYAKAINKIAHWLDAQLGPAMGSETIAYVGPSDPRYAIMVPATIKTGRKVCVNSYLCPRYHN